MTQKIEITQAQILFDCDRVCCICHDRTRKQIQVHHIDSDNKNNEYQNLAVLCLECHGDTMLKGGFGRKLSDVEVRMYRDDWISQISAEKRANKNKPVRHRPSLVLDSKNRVSRAFLSQLYDNRIIPVGTCYDFVAFSFTMKGMIHVITDCSDISPNNAYDREGVLSAYVLCGLGAIVEPGMVSTDTPSPTEYSEPVLSHRPLRNGPTIRIPRWQISGAEDTGILNITVEYEKLTNQVFLFFHPYMIDKRRINEGEGNYRTLDGKLVQIAQSFVGKSLAL
jgi:hypothetical protein